MAAGATHTGISIANAMLTLYIGISITCPLFTCRSVSMSAYPTVCGPLGTLANTGVALSSHRLMFSNLHLLEDRQPTLLSVSPYPGSSFSYTFKQGCSMSVESINFTMKGACKYQMLVHLQLANRSIYKLGPSSWTGQCSMECNITVIPAVGLSLLSGRVLSMTIEKTVLELVVNERDGCQVVQFPVAGRNMPVLLTKVILKDIDECHQNAKCSGPDMTCNNTLGSFHCVQNALSPAATERRTTVSSTSIPEGMVTAGGPVISTLHSTKSPEDPTVPVANVNGNGHGTMYDDAQTNVVFASTEQVFTSAAVGANSIPIVAVVIPSLMSFVFAVGIAIYLFKAKCKSTPRSGTLPPLGVANALYSETIQERGNSQHAAAVVPGVTSTAVAATQQTDSICSVTNKGAQSGVYEPVGLPPSHSTSQRPSAQARQEEIGALSNTTNREATTLSSPSELVYEVLEVEKGVGMPPVGTGCAGAEASSQDVNTQWQSRIPAGAVYMVSDVCTLHTYEDIKNTSFAHHQQPQRKHFEPSISSERQPDVSSVEIRPRVTLQFNSVCGVQSDTLPLELAQKNDMRSHRCSEYLVPGDER